MSEELLVRHCAPTLAGLKTANLFACRFSDGDALRRCLCCWNRRLTKKGLRILPLRFEGRRALIYVYRPARLACDLRQAAAAWYARRFQVELDPEAEIVLYGVSMGAATVMMASGEADLPVQVRCVIEDCGYTSVWDEFSGQLKELFGLPPFPVLNAADLVCRIRAGYSITEASALRQVERSVTPTLFIHGEEDTFVPFWMLEELYQAASCEKEKLAVPGAAHAESAAVAPEKLFLS